MVKESLLEYVEVGVVGEGWLEVGVNNVRCVGEPGGSKFVDGMDSVEDAGVGWEDLGKQVDEASEGVGPPSVKVSEGNGGVIKASDTVMLSKDEEKVECGCVGFMPNLLVEKVEGEGEIGVVQSGGSGHMRYYFRGVRWIVVDYRR